MLRLERDRAYGRCDPFVALLQLAADLRTKAIVPRRLDQRGAHMAIAGSSDAPLGVGTFSRATDSSATRSPLHAQPSGARHRSRREGTPEACPAGLLFRDDGYLDALRDFAR